MIDTFGILGRRRAANSHRPSICRLFLSAAQTIVWHCVLVLLLQVVAIPILAQVSLPEISESSLRVSPRIKMAEDNLKRAVAAVTEAKDVFVPTVGVGSGLGASSGFTLSVPTIFTVSAQSLVFNSSQSDYIRASRLSRDAAELTLRDVRQQVEDDVAETYVSLSTAQHRRRLLEQQEQHATKLVDIVLERFAAGYDTELEVLKCRRDAAEVHLHRLEVDHRIEMLTQHLAALSGKSESDFDERIAPVAPESFASYSDAASTCPTSNSLRSARAAAGAKREVSFGDSRYTWRPQVTLQAQYGRISPFNDVSTYYNLHGKYNTLAVGMEFQLPILDAGRRAKARESAADAAQAQHQADMIAQQEAVSCAQLLQSISELESQKAVSDLNASIASTELHETLITADTGFRINSSTPTTPKEEERVYIQSGGKALENLEIEEKLQQAKIRYLSLSGHLHNWLRSLTVQELAPR